MVIMSDAENFFLKMACAVLGLLFVGFLFAYLKASSVEPEVVYMEPEAIVETDTVFVRDTVYKWMPRQAEGAAEQITTNTETEQ